MNNKEYEQVEQYIYIETILENLNKSINRIQQLEDQNQILEKKIKKLEISIIVCFILIIIAGLGITLL